MNVDRNFKRFTISGDILTFWNIFAKKKKGKKYW